MKNYFLYFILLMPFLLSGQTGLVNYSNSDSAIIVKDSHSDFNEEEIESYLKENKMKFRLSAGAFAGTSFGSGEYFGTYVTPQINYRLSPKFTLTAGMTLTNTFGNPYNYYLAEGGNGYPSANFTRSFLYASGAYQLNERLVLSGTVYKAINLFNQNTFSTKSSAGDYQGMIMGVDYKIGKNIFIQGQIEISNNPYQHYHQPGFYYNSIGNSLFGTPNPF